MPTKANGLRFPSYDDLLAYCDKPMKNNETTTVANFAKQCGLAEKLYKDGKKMQGTGDIEGAFIYLYRAVQFVARITRSTIYKNNEAKLKRDADDAKAVAAKSLETLEAIKPDLKAKYGASSTETPPTPSKSDYTLPKRSATAPTTAGNAAAPQPAVARAASADSPSSVPTTVSAASDNEEGGGEDAQAESDLEKMFPSAPTHLPSAGVGNSVSDSNAADTSSAGSGSESTPSSSSTPSEADNAETNQAIIEHTGEEKDKEEATAENNEPIQLVSAKALKERLSKASTGIKTLILDVRSKSDFHMSAVRPLLFSPPSVNIDPLCLRPGASAEEISEHLANADQRRLFATRTTFAQVFVLTADDPDDATINTLYDSLVTYEGIDPLKVPLYVVQGGYQEFNHRFPSMCTSKLPKTRLQKRPKISPAALLSSYPDEDVFRNKRRKAQGMQSASTGEESSAVSSMTENSEAASPEPSKSVDSAPEGSMATATFHETASNLPSGPSAGSLSPDSLSSSTRNEQVPASTPLDETRRRAPSYGSSDQFPVVLTSSATSSELSDNSVQNKNIDKREPQPPSGVRQQTAMADTRPGPATDVSAPWQSKTGDGLLPPVLEPTPTLVDAPDSAAANTVARGPVGSSSSARPPLHRGQLPNEAAEMPQVPPREAVSVPTPARLPPKPPVSVTQSNVANLSGATIDRSQAREGEDSSVRPRIIADPNLSSTHQGGTRVETSVPGVSSPARISRNGPQVVQRHSSPASKPAVPKSDKPTTGHSGDSARPAEPTPRTLPKTAPTTSRLSQQRIPSSSTSLSSPSSSLAVGPKQRAPEVSAPPRNHQQQQGLRRNSDNKPVPRRSSQSGMEPQHPKPKNTSVVAHKPSRPTFDRALKPPAAQVGRCTPKLRHARLLSFQAASSPYGNAHTGLRNLGNTCFMNSILQCMAATMPVVSYFVEGRYRSDLNRSNPLGHKGELAEEFAELILAMTRRQYKHISPQFFKDVLASFAPQFAGSQQQDSQEFASFLLDGLHEDLNRVRRKPRPQELKLDGLPDPKAAMIAWDDHLTRNDSVIVDLFQGQFKSTIRCETCNYQSTTFSPFMFLTLPVPQRRSCTIQDCLRDFSRTERMSASDGWVCPRCKVARSARRALGIWKLPPILIVHFKRFYFQGPFREKLTTNIDFPLRGLKLRDHIMNPQDAFANEPYTLYGVSNHFGNLTGGHYIGVTYDPAENRWYNYDDTVVRPKPASEVVSNAAYVLFYSAIDFRQLVPTI